MPRLGRVPAADGCVGCFWFGVPVRGAPTNYLAACWVSRVARIRYFTVLSFGILMTAYLKWAGMPQSILGATRGIGAGFGVTATFVYPVYVGNTPHGLLVQWRIADAPHSQDAQAVWAYYHWHVRDRGGVSVSAAMRCYRVVLSWTVRVAPRSCCVAHSDPTFVCLCVCVCATGNLWAPASSKGGWEGFRPLTVLTVLAQCHG